MLNVSMGLRLYREMYNKSKEDLAKYLEIQPKAYARYESGEREPSLDKLYKLAYLYNCKVDDLINVEESFSVDRDDVVSTKDLDNLGCHHQFSHGLMVMMTEGKSYEEMIRFIENDRTKYARKSEVKQFLRELIEKIG